MQTPHVTDSLHLTRLRFPSMSASPWPFPRGWLTSGCFRPGSWETQQVSARMEGRGWKPSTIPHPDVRVFAEVPPHRTGISLCGHQNAAAVTGCHVRRSVEVHWDLHCAPSFSPRSCALGRPVAKSRAAPWRGPCSKPPRRSS